MSTGSYSNIAVNSQKSFQFAKLLDPGPEGCNISVSLFPHARILYVGMYCIQTVQVHQLLFCLYTRIRSRLCVYKRPCSQGDGGVLKIIIPKKNTPED